MTVFSDAIDDLFLDGSIAIAAIYVPSGGPAVPVRIIITQPQEELGGFGAAAISGAVHVEVRMSEVACVAEGDRFEIGIRLLTVGAFRPDAEQLYWKCECSEDTPHA